MTPRMQIIWDVLAAAHDVGDNMVVAACRRLIIATRRGWRAHSLAADYELVLDINRFLAD